MYGEFAFLYDGLMDDVDYEKTADYYESIFKKFGSEINLVLDIGCGSGNLTRIMQGRRYDMIGIDSSPEMLSLAMEKDPKSLYLQMDATDFELYGTVDAIISYLDLVNYLTEDGDVDLLMRLAANYLNYDGLFIFDISTEHKLKNILGNNTLVYDNGEVFYTWENSLDGNLCDMFLTFFVKKENGYERVDEQQTQRIYKMGDITQAAEKAGLSVLGVFGENFSEPKPSDERIYFVLKRRKQ